jgi:hypothetical protein
MKIGDRVFVRGYIDEIRKDTVIIRNAGGYFGTIPSEVIIGDLPPAQPEIIRCKDCRHYEWTSNRVPEEQTWYCYKWNAETGKDDYCSYAERKE